MSVSKEFLQLKELKLKNEDDVLLERVVSAIRFDVDYHLTAGRTVPPSQGSFGKEFTIRINDAIKNGKTVFAKNLRKRVFSALMMSGTVENHMMFNQAIDEFKRRVNRYNTPKPVNVA